MKRVLAFLVCFCMVLGMIPNSMAFLAKAGTNDELALDSSKQALCPACNETVTWTAYNGTSRMFNISDDSHKHIYLAADANLQLDSYVAKLTKGTVCLHLNGHKLSYDGYMQVTGSSSTLNIMGSGEMIFTGTAEQDDGWWKFGIYITSSAKVNLLGGTYSVAETALEAGCPMIQMTAGKLTVDGATVNGTTYVGGQLTIDHDANLENITVTTGGKLTVNKTWTGKATANFASGLTDNMVPAANGAATGTFTGKLTMPGAVTLVATEQGRLEAAGFNAGLV
ncbi:MAG: hypothetical protein J6Q54_00730, partial [Oscillospiraceae bacterium]|nr:hypothetical protein [Oscillospiraceae bacterium]